MAARAPRWPDGDGRRGVSARFGGAGEAMNALSRLLESALGAAGPAAVADTLVSEARSFFRVSSAVLVSVAELEGRVEVVAMDPPGNVADGVLALTELPQVAGALSGPETSRVVSGEEAEALCAALGAGRGARAALLLPMRVRGAMPHMLILADTAGEGLEVAREDLDVAGAFAAAAAAGLAQLQLAAYGAAKSARQAALARAARTLNESLELNRVLVRICEEAVGILDADYANVFLGDATEGLRIEATYGLPADVIGGRVGVGEGLVGKAVERDEPMLTNDYQGLPRQVKLPHFKKVRSSLAVPMHWEGRLRGALAVGYFRSQLVTHDQLGLLEAFGDLAGVACRNASAHAGLALAARTDALTGCLNHAALHETLARELERCRRTGHSISLAIVDLDDFKQVNEHHGHLAGDDVLRRVGLALRQSVRSYDFVARYGGDEFAIVAVDADEREAIEVATRAIEGVARALERVARPAGSLSVATGGVAEWHSGLGPTGLIAEADRALLFGKQRGTRGVAVPASGVPEDFMPVGAVRHEPAHDEGDHAWSDRTREQTERLRRRTRQLSVTGSLAARLVTLEDPAEIVVACVDELDRAFGHFLTAVLKIRGDGYVESLAVRGAGAERSGMERWAQPLDSGLIGRCIRERRAVLADDVRAENDYRLVPAAIDVRSELAVPIWVGKELWGVIDLEDVRPDAYDEDDARAIQAVAHQVGLALRAARGQAEADSESSSARQSRSTLAT